MTVDGYKKPPAKQKGATGKGGSPNGGKGVYANVKPVKKSKGK